MTAGRLAGALVAGLVAASIMGELDAFATREKLERSISNHADFEGARPPHEAALATARRRLDRMEGAIDNHAHHEGAEVLA